MKIRFWILIGILILAVLIWGISGYLAGKGDRAKVSEINGEVISDFSGEKVKVNPNESLLEFEGYKVGGSHLGTFEEWEAYVYINNEIVNGFEGTAKVASVKTDNEKVDAHLQTDDFFDAEKYPEVKFKTTKIDYENLTVTGILEFHGVKKEVSFPILIEDYKISGDFYLDAKPFNFKYTGVNPEVRIKFDFNY